AAGAAEETGDRRDTEADASASHSAGADAEPAAWPAVHRGSVARIQSVSRRQHVARSHGARRGSRTQAESAAIGDGGPDSHVHDAGGAGSAEGSGDRRESGSSGGFAGAGFVGKFSIDDSPELRTGVKALCVSAGLAALDTMQLAPR